MVENPQNKESVQANVSFTSRQIRALVVLTGRIKSKTEDTLGMIISILGFGKITRCSQFTTCTGLVGQHDHWFAKYGLNW